MDNVVIVSKARSIGTRPTKSVCIEIAEDTPEFSSLDEAAVWFGAQARQIEKALSHHLPGGTYDQILARMLRHKASLLAIAYEEEGGSE